MNIPTTAVKDISLLSPIIQVMFNHASANYAKKNVNGKNATAFIVETIRTVERQQFIFCQGRTIEQCVAAGIPRETAKIFCEYASTHGYKSINTKTMNSIHIKKRAMDVVPYVDLKNDGSKTLIWSYGKVNQYVKELVLSMNRYGFEDGDSWKSFVDSPHFQVNVQLNKVVSKSCTTKHLTRAIQNALNSIINKGLLKKFGVSEILIVDGSWGPKLDAAVIAFRKLQKYKNVNPILGSKALDRLFTLYDKYTK